MTILKWILILCGSLLVLSLPTGKQIPVNYLRENGKVFAGADGPWSPVQMMIRDESLSGVARVILDDQASLPDNHRLVY